MGEVVFQQILFLIGKGYRVDFSKAGEFQPAQVLRIVLSKGEHHHMECVDISIGKDTKHHRDVTVDYLISRALSRAEYELEYYIKKENNEE